MHRLSEVRTPRYCIHPYFGFVCTPNSVQDFAEAIPALDRPAIAQIDAWGFRNRSLPAVKPEGETWIGLFGGSVAFSVASSTNDTTIAGYLESELRARAAAGHRIRVVNFALPAGQQPQSLLIFTMWVAQLDGAVVFDGVNESVIPAYYNGNALPANFPYRPFYEPLFARSLTDDQRAIQWNLEQEESALAAMRRSWWSVGDRRRLRRRIAEIRRQLNAASPSTVTLESVYPRPAGGVDELIAAGIDNWRDCTRTMDALARAMKREFVSILQPMPERLKPLTARELKSVQGQPEAIEIRRRGYRRLSEHASELRSQGVACLDFGDVFADQPGDMYVDIGHFTDHGCQVVAQRMAGAVVGRWQCLGGSTEAD